MPRHAPMICKVVSVACDSADEVAHTKVDPPSADWEADVLAGCVQIT
jgi:hypothetical protein